MYTINDVLYKIKNSKGLIIDGIGASEAIDSSGEILSVKGCDISSVFDNSLGCVLNWEHQGVKDSEEKNPEFVVGKVIYAKKIYSEQDCETERQLEYFNSVKVPIIYIIGRLFTDHPKARSYSGNN
jgi:hypothetical protein